MNTKAKLATVAAALAVAGGGATNGMSTTPNHDPKSNRDCMETGFLTLDGAATSKFCVTSPNEKARKEVMKQVEIVYEMARPKIISYEIKHETCSKEAPIEFRVSTVPVHGTLQYCHPSSEDVERLHRLLHTDQEATTFILKP